MIAPIREPESRFRSLSERRKLRKARKWIVQSLLSRNETGTPLRSPVSPRQAWLLAGWAVVVAAYFFWQTVARFFDR